MERHPFSPPFLQPGAVVAPALFGQALAVFLVTVPAGCSDSTVTPEGAGHDDAGAPFTRDSSSGGADTSSPALDTFPTSSDTGAPVPDGGGPTLPSDRGPLVVESLTPQAGPTVGGTVVSVTGSGFVRPTAVMLGGAVVEEVVVRSRNLLEFTTPPGEPGTVDLQVENANGIAFLGQAFTYYEDVGIESVQPDTSPTTGGQAVVVSGRGFVPGAVVTIGSRPAIGVEVVDPTTLRAVTPPHDPGPRDVRVFVPSGAAVLRDAITYFRPVGLHRVTPVAGPVTGGTEVRVEGEGFVEGTTLTVGGNPAVVLGIADDGGTLTARTPAGAGPGPVDVAAENLHGRAVLPAAFTYYPEDRAELDLLSVTPDHGPTTGGQLVVLTGTGFLFGALVTFGEAPAACTVDSPNMATCTTPRGEAGAVDVTLRQGDRVARLRAGYTYTVPLSVASVRPAIGPVAGGTSITVRGSGFDPGTTLTVGVLPARDIRVLDGTTLTALTPPGAPGPADVVVVRDRDRAVLGGGFFYADSPRLLAVEPGEGSMAGGTYVTLLGSGLVPGTTVTFGGNAATEVSVVNGSTLTAYTPPGQEGPVDVTATLPDGAVLTLPGGFRYYNPATLFGGTWGGPVMGSVNLTVIDAQDGSPIEGAFAQLWADPDTPYQGLTDQNGQITFSGPDLFGRQMVSAIKDGFAAASVVAFNATNVTVALQPKPEPSQGPMPPGVPPGVIRGRIIGMNKYLPDPGNANERKVTYVTTTASSIETLPYRPDPGPGGTVYGDGEYQIFSRLGELAVVAIGGILNVATREFRPARMGVRRFLFVDGENDVNGADIDLSIPMNQVADLRLDCQPFRPGGPDVLVIQPYIDFDAEGVWDLGRYVSYTGEPLPGVQLSPMPAMNGPLRECPVFLIAGAYTRDESGPTYPFSIVNETGIRSFDREIRLGPFVGIPEVTNPRLFEAVSNDTLEWEIELGCTEPSGQLLFIGQPGLVWIPVWDLFVAGDVRSVVLPDFRRFQGFPSGDGEDATVVMGIEPIYQAGFSIDEFEYSDFAPLSLDGYSLNAGVFHF